MKVKKILSVLLAGAMTLGMLTGCGSTATEATTETAAKETVATENAEAAGTETAEGKEFEGVTISLLRDTSMPSEGMDAVIELAKEKYGLIVEVEEVVGGSDDLIKTRLASGDITDICLYNSGSLLKALNPAEYFEDLSNEDFVATLDDTYKETVTVDGAVYGVPISSTQAGAVLYYKPDYEELGLKVPTTWDEFMANCKALKDAGKTAVIATFGDSWTSQVTYLGDNYNVIANNPDFVEKFEAGETKYATTPEGVASFQKLLDMKEFYNEDYLAATYDDGCDMLANGEGTHWIMLTQTLSNIYSLYPDVINDIGVFAIPGDDAEKNGLTVWMPNSFYVNKNAENKEAIMAFLGLYVSKEGLDTYASKTKPDGPYCIKGYSLPEDAYPAVREDMQAYFDKGATCPALEFMTSVKGSNCASICVEVGSGQTTAEVAAEAYDDDCKKQAVQLGLNWK